MKQIRVNNCIVKYIINKQVCKHESMYVLFCNK